MKQECYNIPVFLFTTARKNSELLYPIPLYKFKPEKKLKECLFNFTSIFDAMVINYKIE